MSKTILIACKLPNGIALEGMGGKLDIVKLNGTNSARIEGAPGLTYVDETQAQYLLATYSELAPFKTKAIYTFETDSVADIVSMTEDLADNKTGLEGVDPDAPAANLKPEDDGALKTAKAQAEAKPRPAKPVSKADKAAAAQLAAELSK